MADLFSVGGLMVRRDRPSFSEWFPKHLENVMPLVDHLYVRIDPKGDDVLEFLEPYGDRIHWDWQYERKTDAHTEAAERQAILSWGLETGAEWMHCFDSDEVLEDGVTPHLRRFLEADPPYRVLIYPLTYSSHHRPGYLLDRSETSVSVGRGFRLSDPEIRNFRYVGDRDGLHCGTLPSESKNAAVLREIHTIHYHACSPEEWLQKREFYDNTVHVRRWGGIEKLYPLCENGCDRFGKESNARPAEEVLANGPERWTRLERRVKVKADA